MESQYKKIQNKDGKWEIYKITDKETVLIFDEVFDNVSLILINNRDKFVGTIVDKQAIYSLSQQERISPFLYKIMADKYLDGASKYYLGINEYLQQAIFTEETQLTEWHNHINTSFLFSNKSLYFITINQQGQEVQGNSSN